MLLNGNTTTNTMTETNKRGSIMADANFENPWK